MKEYEFSADQLPDIEALKKAMFEDENDPRSNNYKRKLNRPKINWLRVILSLFLLPVLLFLISWLLIAKGVSAVICIIASLLILLIYTAIRLKSAVICAVRIYQRFAPDSIRNKCRFEPSCSEYMILALEKYGLFKGLLKGIDRMKRCNINDGGFDYP